MFTVEMKRRFALSVGVLGFLVLMSQACGGRVPPPGSITTEGLEVRYLVDGKKVIPVDCAIGDWRITDIKMPDLVVTNGGKKTVAIERLDIVGKAGGTETIRLQVPREELMDSIKKTANRLNSNRPPLFSLQAEYGNIVLPEGILSENGTAARNQSILLPLSKIIYLHYVGLSRVDALQAELTVKVGGKNHPLSFPIRVTSYESKGKYLFPLKGDLHMAFIPLSYIHHRGSGSQEFAMDVVAAAQKDAASFTEISTPNPKSLSDYGIWNREVMAIGNGEVVEIGDKFPEALMSDPAKFNDPKYVNTVLKDLIGKIGITNALAGNYVTIDHGNGEFSIYCHLKEGSIQVKPGDHVDKGAVIARVGNTGNSSAPHLHFQVMDGKDFLTANGLPMMFENAPASSMLIEYPIKANTLSFSDNLFYSIATGENRK